MGVLHDESSCRLYLNRKVLGVYSLAFFSSTLQYVNTLMGLFTNCYGSARGL